MKIGYNEAKKRLAACGKWYMEADKKYKETGEVKWRNIMAVQAQLMAHYTHVITEYEADYGWREYKID